MSLTQYYDDQTTALNAATIVASTRPHGIAKRDENCAVRSFGMIQETLGTRDVRETCIAIDRVLGGGVLLEDAAPPLTDDQGEPDVEKLAPKPPADLDYKPKKKKKGKGKK